MVSINQRVNRLPSSVRYFDHAPSSCSPRNAALAAPDAVWELARNGQAEAVVALIAELAPEAQKEVLAARDAIWALADSGQAEAVMALIVNRQGIGTLDRLAIGTPLRVRWGARA